MLKKITQSFFFIYFFVLVIPVSAAGIVYINSDYTANNSAGHTFGIDAFNKIQDGINVVEEKGIVKVSRGTYHENLIIEKSLSLIGEGLATTTGASYDAPSIDGGTSTNPAVITVQGISDLITVNISNLNINHANNGINVLQNASMVIENNTVSDYYKNGITFGPVRFPGYGGVHGIISNNIVIGNGPTNAVAQNGIQISESNTASINDNIVSNNFYMVPNSWWGVGILTSQSNGVSIYNNTLNNNQAGINIKKGSHNLISNNNLIGTTTTEVGILLSESDDVLYPVDDNTINSNAIFGGNNSILAYNNINKNIFTNNTFNNKYIEMTINEIPSQSLIEKQNNQGMVLGASSFIFSKNLNEGSSGEDVIELQKVLIANNFLYGKATGYFGIYTKKALMDWQAKNNIPITGFFGNISRIYINSNNNLLK